MAERTRFLRNEIRFGILAFVALLVAGTLGFKFAGGPEWTVFDGFYMTILTVTTVGYHEVHELDLVGRVVAIAVILFGVGIGLYVVGTTAEALIEGKIFWRRRMASVIHKMSDHFVVCGHGRVGRTICKELAEHGENYVVIEKNEDSMAGADCFLLGDATDENVLREAGIDKARGLVSVLGSDAENIYTVLAARSLRPELFIVARCGEPRSYKSLLSAGAHRVINPYERSGVLMATMLLRPAVVDFMEEVSHAAGLDIVLGEVRIEAESGLTGMTLRDSGIRERFDAIVTAIVKRSGEKVFNPPTAESIEAGDILIAMGRPSAIDELTEYARGGATKIAGGDV